MNLKKYIVTRIKNDKIHTLILSIYAIFCLFSVGYFGIILKFRNVLLAFISLAVIPFMFLVEYYFEIELVNLFTVIALLIASGGMLLGPGYDLYMKYDWYDDALHTLSGILFPCLGFALSKCLIKDDKFFVHLIFGAMFSLSIALLWEMFEYFGTAILGLDMQEDRIIESFRSFYLAGSHNDIVIVEDITKTIIYYGNGKEIIIDGFLDIGLFDTLYDMFVCLIVTIVYFVVLLIDKKQKGNIEKLIIPQPNRILNS